MMEKEIINQLNDLLNKDLNNEIKNDYQFDELKLNKDLSMIFIDGGNNEIFFTPTFSLNIIKISAIIFEKGIRKKIFTKECYLFSENNQTKIINKTNLINNNEDINYSWINFNSKYNEKNAEIFRRLNELNLAKELNKIYKNYFIIIDGTLRQQFKESNEEKNLLKEISNENENIYSLVKTNKEKENHLSLSGNLNNISPKNITWKTNIFEKENINYIYSKLNKNSKYIFKIEFFNKETNLKKINFLLENLVHNSSDLIFLGYPYGLILADKFAKVSNEEINYIKNKIKTKINSINLENELNALNVHDKLDEINN